MASPDRFDGLEVDQHQARFSGTVELDPTDADNMSLDTQFMAVVVCTVAGATVTDNAKGEIVRTNKFKLHDFAVVRDGQLRNDLYEKLPALAGADAPVAGEQLFVGDENGERIVIEGTVADDGVVEVSSEDFQKLQEFNEDVQAIEEEEEIFSPGATRPVSAPQPVGVSTGGAVPRKYDPALDSFLRE